MARQLARALGATLVTSTTTRLLVDLNRSRSHPALFSAVTRGLSPAARDDILRRAWEPYRRAVAAAVARAVAGGRPVVHVSSHSFTPVLDGTVRAVDVGLLYDPSRRRERAIAVAWRRAIRERDPSLRVRRNRPYRGVSDGLATALRRRHCGRDYAGVELEVNQALVTGPPARWRRVRRTVTEALAAALRALDG
jgi:predicted N-formylglutamate amidohydrolase